MSEQAPEAEAEAAGAAYDKLVRAGISPEPDLLSLFEWATKIIEQNWWRVEATSCLEEGLTFVREAHEGPSRSVTIYGTWYSICIGFWDATFVLQSLWSAGT